MISSYDFVFKKLASHPYFFISFFWQAAVKRQTLKTGLPPMHIKTRTGKGVTKQKTKRLNFSETFFFGFKLLGP